MMHHTHPRKRVTTQGWNACDVTTREETSWMARGRREGGWCVALWGGRASCGVWEGSRERGRGSGRRRPGSALSMLDTTSEGG